MNISTLGLLIALIAYSVDLSSSDTISTSNSTTVYTGNTIVDDLNGLIR